MTWRDMTIISLFCLQSKLDHLLLPPSSATIICIPHLLSPCYFEPLPFSGCLWPRALPSSLWSALDGPFQVSAAWPPYNSGVADGPQLARWPSTCVQDLFLVSYRSLTPFPLTMWNAWLCIGEDAGERGGDVKPSSITVGKVVVMVRVDQVIFETLMLPIGTDRTVVSAQSSSLFPVR